MTAEIAEKTGGTVVSSPHHQRRTFVVPSSGGVSHGLIPDAGRGNFTQRGGWYQLFRGHRAELLDKKFHETGHDDPDAAAMSVGPGSHLGDPSPAATRKRSST